MRVTVDDSHDTDADTLGVYLDDGTEVGRLPVLQHCQIEAMNLRQMLWAVSQEAVKVERKRCSAIVQAAREGEIDGDFRSLIHRINSGTHVPEVGHDD